MKRQISIDRIRLDDLLSALGGFAGADLGSTRKERVLKLLSKGLSGVLIAQREGVTKSAISKIKHRTDVRPTAN